MTSKPNGKPKAYRSMQDRKEVEKRYDLGTEKRMQAVVRAQGRLTKKEGIMTSTGVAEFQISNVTELEKLLNK